MRRDSGIANADNSKGGPAGQMEPDPSQFLRRKGRQHGPPLRDRVLVFDPDMFRLSVQGRKDIEKDNQKYLEIPLRKDISEITLLYDPDDTDVDIISEFQEWEGVHNWVPLVRLYLDKLGTMNRILRKCGNMSILYIRTDQEKPQWQKDAQFPGDGAESITSETLAEPGPSGKGAKAERRGLSSSSPRLRMGSFRLGRRRSKGGEAKA